MPLTGAKTRSQNPHRRRKFSEDSGIASLASGPRTSRESCPPPALTFEHVVGDANSPLLHRTHHSSGSVELGQTSIAEPPRGKVRRVESWLKEQQRINNSIDDSARDRIAKAAGTPCNPYLAYPGLSRCTVWQDEDDDDILDSFVIVEEEEPEDEHLGSLDSPNNLQRAVNGFLTTSATSYASSTRPPSRPASILSVTPWRNLPFTKTLPVHRSSSAPGEPVDLSTPPASLRLGSVRRRSPIPEDFLSTGASSSSMPGKTAQNKSSNSTLKASSTPKGSVRKRLGNLMRPNTSSSASLVSPEAKRITSSPRPSTSASAKTATTSTAVENDVRSSEASSPKRFLPKISLSLAKPVRGPAAESTSVRLDSPTRSSFSANLHHDEPVDPDPVVEQPLTQPEAPFVPMLSKRRSHHNIFHDRRHNASSSALSTLSIGSIGTLASNINGRASSVFSASSTARRKRLVVSGIAPDDAAAMEGLRRWCERFGELRQITRMPNGDLHIDFKRAEVADTVCRISARVHIADVGSVNMSWISGRRH